MRQKRAKSYKRLVHQYVLHFQFREPFQVLIDNSFAESLVQYKLGNVLCVDKVKPMITQCCMVALYNAEKEAESEDKMRISQAIALAKQWERRKCNHREPLAPLACLEQVIGPTNKHRYMLAANEPPLRRALRRVVPGLPIVHYSQSVLVLEPMSDVTERYIATMEVNKSAISSTERKLLAQDTEAEASQPALQPVKRKRPKAPNPLSVKKPKNEKKAPKRAEPPTSTHTTAQQTSRRRKKRGRGSGAVEASHDTD
ncbi:hypothetical protein MBRA1_000950 [Malassezia brasiliensis]|uniref:UTP23 sensor motif region domain-containing protein n=1 Tax=Malassezia brasiliensis TaxID=1821822 RepID=A0AAF0INZ4_9BASI|nr:hypothetical protein MBRA1_000950 [Malassezia brasiliensis]